METVDETATYDELLQTATAEREELDQLRRTIDAQIMRLILTPLESVKMVHIIQLQEDLDRWAVLRRKYTVI